MTLILGIYARWNALQVSDRLTSLRGSPGTPWDPLANKTVVYFARRGIVSISYTGPAYLSGKPTDQWLAETLSGIDLSNAGALAFGRQICHQFDVGQALEHLRREAEATMLKQALQVRRELLEFVVTGSQWDRRLRLRPVMCKITNRRAAPAFEKLVIPRVWDIQNGWYSIGAGVEQDIARVFMRQRFQATGGLLSPDHCADVMTEAIRDVSAQHSDAVGPNVMCVHICAESPRVRISYRPQTQHRLQTRDGEVVGPVAFTPYLVARDMVAVPSSSTNNLFLTVPGVDVRFVGTDSQPIEQMPATLQHLQRRSPPH